MLSWRNYFPLNVALGQVLAAGARSLLLILLALVSGKATDAEAAPPSQAVVQQVPKVANAAVRVAEKLKLLAAEAQAALASSDESQAARLIKQLKTVVSEHGDDVSPSIRALVTDADAALPGTGGAGVKPATALLSQFAIYMHAVDENSVRRIIPAAQEAAGFFGTFLRRVVVQRGDVLKFSEKIYRGATSPDIYFQMERISNPRVSGLIDDFLSVPKSERIMLIGSRYTRAYAAVLKKLFSPRKVFFYEFCEQAADQLCSEEAVGAFMGSAGQIIQIAEKGGGNSQYVKVEERLLPQLLVNAKLYFIDGDVLMQGAIVGGGMTAAALVWPGQQIPALEVDNLIYPFGK